MYRGYRGKGNVLILAMAALALTACGGGGGGGNVPKTSSGKAVDGYLAGAVVLCDANGNGIADAGEVTVVSDEQGGFAFNPACAHTIVVTSGQNADTDVPFKGVLKAPAGSAVATPLTSLMVAGLSGQQMNAALSIAGGTDLTKVDPAARNAGGALVNPALLQKTLAVQQIVQQTASAIAALALDNTSTVGQAIYSDVVAAMAQVLGSSPQPILIDNDGKVDAGVVKSIVTQAVSRSASSANPVLASVKSRIAAYSPSSVAELVTGSIEAQAELLASSAYSAGTTKALQTNPTTSNTVAGVSAMLQSGSDASVDMASAGQELKAMVQAQLAGDAVAQNQALSRLSQNVGQQATLAGIGLSFDFGTLHNHADYFSILNDVVAINGKDYLIHDLLDGQKITPGTLASINSVSFTLNTVGNPIPADSNGVKTATVSMGFEISEMDVPHGRVLQGILDKVVITAGKNGGISLTIPAGANLYIHGESANGVKANVKLPNVDPDTVTATSSAISFNPSSIMNNLKAMGDGKAATAGPFADIADARGKFYFKILVTEIDIRKCDLEASFAPYLTVRVEDSHLPPVSGFGVEGIVTIEGQAPAVPL